MYHQPNYAQYGQAMVPPPGQGHPYPQPMMSYNQVSHFPGVQQEGYAPPPPQQMQMPFGQPAQGDPNAFAHIFKGQLAGLTFNSKPIINQLTILAHENASLMAPVVAQCLEEHIMTAPPAYRLPALYALDSICKNVGSPYTTLWAERIVMIFMETYRVVDHAVKGRMEELLNTWRHAGPHQSTLFGPAAQQTIERSIWGASGPPQSSALSPRVQHLQQQHGNARGGTNSPMHAGGSTPNGFTSAAAALLARFDRLIDTCAYDQKHAPHLFDGTRMDALVKLRAIVASTNLAHEELGQIVQQLDVLESEMQQRSTPQIRSPLHSGNNGYRATPPGLTAIPPSLAGALANLGQLTAGVGGTTPPSYRSTPPPPLMSGQRPNVALDLVASLRQAGLLPSAPVVEQDNEYCEMIKSMEFKLTTIDLQREVLMGSLEAIMTKELPLQCRQCANRYPAGPKGQASHDRHLDWHFRQNRRAKDSAARGQSRSWFSKLHEWVRGGHDDTAPPRRAGDDSEQGGAGATLTPAQEAELKAVSKKFVVAPSDDPEAAATPCPICKELFKSEWSEDEEEWIWKNCVLVDGRYFHASCHYSAKALSQTVGRSGNSSTRETTPQQSGPGSPPKPSTSKMRSEVKAEDEGAMPTAQLAGTKRKNDVDDEAGDEEKEEEDTATPSKRAAIA